jgi:hypothetical protein
MMAVPNGGKVTVRRSEMMGSSTEPTVLDSGERFCIAAGLAEAAAAADKAGAVGFAGDFALTLALAHHQVQQPRRFFLLGTGAAGAENGGRFGREFRLHEQIAERRMRRVRVRRGEHHFRVTGQFNLRVTGERLVMVMRRNSTSSSGETLISVWISRPA